MFARGRPQVSPTNKKKLFRSKQISNPDRFLRSVGDVVSKFILFKVKWFCIEFFNKKLIDVKSRSAVY